MQGSTHHVQTKQSPHVSVVQPERLGKILSGELQVFQSPLSVLHLCEEAINTANKLCWRAAQAMTAWHLNKQYMTILCKHFSFHEPIFPMTLSVGRCLSVSERGTIHRALTFIPQLSPMLDDGHPGKYLPQRTAHSTSDCEGCSSSAPPDKTQLFHSCGSHKQNSESIDIAVDVSSFSLLNCEVQVPCPINLQVSNWI